jgi:hypothetical protein
VDLEEAVRGRAALEALGPDLPEVAQAAGIGRKRLEDTLRSDVSLWVDECGLPFYIEPQSADIPPTEAAPAEPTDPDPLALHSRPGSTRTLFLDFDGHQIENTAWNAGTGAPGPFFASAYSLDSDPTLTASELAVVEQVWQRVAEDYAPFDVDVTTEDPGSAAITRSGPSDQSYGTRVLITNTQTIHSSCRCGGIAYLSVFDTPTNHAYYQPAFVFTNGVGTGPKGIAEAASHEAGHNFGLVHDGTSTRSYYAGHGPWAPIMGVGYYQPVTQWSKGEYTGANSTQNDLAVIADNGAPTLQDTVPDTSQAAEELTPGTRPGMIESPTDVDWFRFDAEGPTTISATPSAVSPNLDLQLTLYDEDGVAASTADPPILAIDDDLASGMDARIQVVLPAGRYRLEVDGVGSGTPSTGYSDYGSLGPYTLTVSTGSPALFVQKAPAPPATVGTPYRHKLSASGTGPFQWRLTDGTLPAGLSLDPDGLVSGTPTTPGTARATVEVATGEASATAQLSIAVQPAQVVDTPPPPAPTTPSPQQASTTVRITTARLPAATKGARYRTRLRSVPGDARWSTAPGALPRGMRLTQAGVLRGKPGARGRFAFVARVDLGELRTQRAFVLRVRR